MSLFSGIGGFDLALKNMGHEIVGACEIDKYARQIYKRHFPGIPIWLDACSTIPEELPDFELLCAGFPCQTFSIAGRRLGFEESRGTLFFEIARIARQKRPRYLLLENVTGLLNHDNGRTFANILAALDEIGYDAEWQVLNSKYFVPQNRPRIFIIGHLREEPSRQIFPLGDRNKINLRTREKTQGSRSRIRSPYSGTVQTTARKGAATYVRTIDSNYYKGPQGRTMIKMIQNAVHSTNRVYDPSGIARALRANSGGLDSKTGVYQVRALTEARTDHAKEMRKKLQKEEGRDYVARRDKDIVERKDNLSNCITASRDIEKLIRDGNAYRQLTPLECERLQGFPDDWTKGISDVQRYKCLGNAVTVPVVEYILSHF